MKLTTENYLKAIFSLSDKNTEEGVKIKQIAESLSVSSAAVTDQVKKLSALDYVKQLKNRSLSLTKKGESIAIKVIRYHRLWETYLNKVLGMPWDQLHDEAERLEHACSENLMTRIDEALGFPHYDPHGNPIPSKDGIFPDTDETCSLAKAEKGKQYRLIRVVQLDKQYLSYMVAQGLEIGTKLLVTDKLAFDESILCEIDSKSISISASAAQNIFVEIL